MKNILVITSVETGGEWHMVREVVSGLKAIKGYSFDFVGICRSIPDATDMMMFSHRQSIFPVKKNKPFQYLKQMISLIVLTRKALSNCLRTTSYDWILVTDYIGRIAALTLPTTWNIPVLLYFHGIKSSLISSLRDLNYYEIIVKILERFSLLTSNTIVVPSLFGKQIIRRMILPFSKPVHVIPNCIPDIFFETFRRKEHVAFTVLYAGRLVEYKGLRLLIDAVISFKKEKIPIRLVICYPSHNVEEELLQHIWNMKNDYKDTLSIYKDVSQKDLREYYRSSDVLVLPSLMESSPLSILEALSQGALCIASDTGNNREILEHIDTRFILPSCDVSSIQEVLRWVYNLPPSKKIKYRRKAIALAKQYNRKNTVEAFHRILSFLV